MNEEVKGSLKEAQEKAAPVEKYLAIQFGKDLGGKKGGEVASHFFDLANGGVIGLIKGFLPEENPLQPLEDMTKEILKDVRSIYTFLQQLDLFDKITIISKKYTVIEDMDDLDSKSQADKAEKLHNTVIETLGQIINNFNLDAPKFFTEEIHGLSIFDAGKKVQNYIKPIINAFTQSLIYANRLRLNPNLDVVDIGTKFIHDIKHTYTQFQTDIITQFDCLSQIGSMWVSQQASLQEGKNDNICHFKVQLKNVATNEYCITSTLKDGSEHYPVLLRDSNTINNIDKWEQTIFQVEYNGRLSGFNVEKGEFQNIGYNYLEEGNIYWRLDFYLDRNAADLIRVYGFSEVTTGQENKTHKAIQVAISTQTPAYGFFDSYDGLTVRNSNYGADGPCPEQLFWLIMTPDQ